MLFGAFAGAPAAVDGTFAIEEGVAHSEDLTVRGRNAEARTKGSADLPDWVLDSTTEVFRDTAPEDAYLSVRLSGPHDELNVAIDGHPLKRQPAAAEPAAQPDAGHPPASCGQRQPQTIDTAQLPKAVLAQPHLDLRESAHHQHQGQELS